MNSVPQEINFPKEAFVVIFIILMYYIQSIYISTYLHTYLLIFGFGGAPVDQPPLGRNGKALNQPKLHPSNKTV